MLQSTSSSHANSAHTQCCTLQREFQLKIFCGCPAYQPWCLNWRRWPAATPVNCLPSLQISNIQADLPLLSEHDVAAIRSIAEEHEIDFISLTFTKDGQDVEDMRWGGPVPDILHMVEAQTELVLRAGLVPKSRHFPAHGALPPCMLPSHSRHSRTALCKGRCQANTCRL